MQMNRRALTLPLEYVSELAFEMHLMRGECGDLARQLLNQPRADERLLDECAQLEEALAEAHRVLHSVTARIHKPALTKRHYQRIVRRVAIA